MANKKILVAEDDKFLANAYRVKLGKAGFDVQIAVNGEKAVKFLTSSTYDVMLLDLIMPKIDGFGVLEKLKEMENVKIPVIIASNLGQKEDIDKGLALGAVDYVIKSDLSLDEVIEKINKVLK